MLIYNIKYKYINKKIQKLNLKLTYKIYKI